MILYVHDLLSGLNMIDDERILNNPFGIQKIEDSLYIIYIC